MTEPRAKPRIDSIKIRRQEDEDADLSHLGEYGQEWREGAIDRKEANGHLDSSEYRYWYPGSNHYPHNPKNWAHIPKEEKAEVIAQYGSLQKADESYMLQDYRRMEAYGRDWWMIGIDAKAEVSYATGDGSRRLEWLKSGGLWGIESDSGDEYFREVAKNELADLKAHLEAFGVDTSDFDAKAQEALSAF